MILSKLKKLAWEWRGALITAPSIAFLVMGLRFAGWLQPLEWAAFDQYFLWRRNEPTEPRIVIVGINELDINNLGQWPMTDEVLAQLLEKLKEQQPRALGLDLVRDVPVEPDHQALIKVFETTPNLIGIEKLPDLIGENQKIEDKSSGIAPPPQLDDLHQVAAADLVLDPDGRVRRGLLFLKTHKGKSVKSLGLKLALMYLEREGITSSSAGDKDRSMALGETVFKRFRANDGGYVRADDGGYQILLNYTGPKGSFTTVSMSDVLASRIPPDLMRDRIVLVGVTAASLKDRFYTPYSNHLITAPEFTSGV